MDHMAQPPEVPSPSSSSPAGLFCFGFGYTCAHTAHILRPQGWRISGTTMDAEKRAFLAKAGITAYLFDSEHPLPDAPHVFAGMTHLLLSIPPNEEGDPVWQTHGAELAQLPSLKWVGYLSSTAVYGDQDGNWIDEKTPANPTSRRGSLRLKAEQQWTDWAKKKGIPLHIFRLAGIYGPGRSAIESVLSGTARRIHKPGHVFNRIHVEDAAQVIAAAMVSDKPSGIYNLADDLPTPSHEVIAHACALLGQPPPPLLPYTQSDLPPMVNSFYKENKRIRNDKIKQDFGIKLLYPDYTSGLQSCLDDDNDSDDDDRRFYIGGAASG